MNYELEILSDPLEYKEKEECYIRFRKKENRIYSDDEVLRLPEIDSSHNHFNEWIFREQNTIPLLKYFKQKEKSRVLDIGCGNGWLTNQIANLNHQVTGIDLNMPELSQACRIFSKENLQFKYADITKKPALGKFDVILLAASAQYFKDIKYLTEILIQNLNKNGEIHIIQTFTYNTLTEVTEARNRTKQYYINLGIPEAAEFYYHHHIDHFKTLGYKIKNRSILDILKLKIMKDKSLLFPWLILKN